MFIQTNEREPKGPEEKSRVERFRDFLKKESLPTEADLHEKVASMAKGAPKKEKERMIVMAKDAGNEKVSHIVQAFLAAEDIINPSRVKWMELSKQVEKA